MQLRNAESVDQGENKIMVRLIVGVIAFVVIGMLALAVVQAVLGTLGTIIHLAIVAVIALVGVRVALSVMNRVSARRA